MDVMISPSEPRDIKVDFGNYGIINPHLPVDYGWYTEGRLSLTERKFIPNDFLASKSDGRLQREIQALLENIENGGRSYLLQEGHWSCDKNGMILNPRPTGWSIDKISELLSTIWDTGIKPLWSPNIKQTALVLISQARWERKGSHKSLSIRPGPVVPWGKPSYSTYVTWCYQGIPGVGADIAEILYEAAPNLAELTKLTIEDLRELKHFGEKRSKQVFKFIHEGKL